MAEGGPAAGQGEDDHHGQRPEGQHGAGGHQHGHDRVAHDRGVVGQRDQDAVDDHEGHVGHDDEAQRAGQGGQPLQQERGAHPGGRGPGQIEDGAPFEAAELAAALGRGARVEGRAGWRLGGVRIVEDGHLSRHSPRPSATGPPRPRPRS